MVHALCRMRILNVGIQTSHAFCRMRILLYVVVAGSQLVKSAPQRKNKAKTKSWIKMFQKEEKVSVIKTVLCGVITFGYVVSLTKNKKLLNLWLSLSLVLSSLSDAALVSYHSSSCRLPLFIIYPEVGTFRFSDFQSPQLDFYLISSFYSSKEVLVILTQICLWPLYRHTHKHTHGQATIIHMSHSNNMYQLTK